MIKLIRLVLLAAVVLGATVLMALPKDPASAETAQLQRNESNESDEASAAGAAHAPAAEAAIPTVDPRETGPILPGSNAGNGSGNGAAPEAPHVPGTTILPAPPPAESEGRTVWPKTHTIQPGETLQKIAKQYYGGFSKWRRIADANPGVDPTRIRPGQKLKIPAPAR